MVSESKAKALAIAQASLAKKADDVLVLHVAPLTSIADFLVLCSAESDRQVRAVAEHIEALASEHKIKPLSLEGLSTAQWVVMDFADVVVHVFRRDVREHYALERLWSDAKRVRIPEDPVKLISGPPPVKKRVPRRANKGR